MSPWPVRFWKKVLKENNCWLWLGTRDGGGYGMLSVNNKMEKAHRLSYVLHKGEIPAGFHVCHTCDNTSCVNPSHLFAGTRSDNMLDMTKKGRRYMPLGSKHSHAKLTEGMVLSIREAYKVLNISQAELAELHGVTQWAVGCVITRKTWKHI